MSYRPAAAVAPPRGGFELGRALTCLGAVCIALTGALVAPGIARSNQTYPEAVSPRPATVAGTGPGAAPGAATSPTRYLTRRAVEGIAKKGIGKLEGLRVGPFAPGAASRAMPLGKAESLIVHSVAGMADPNTPAWVVTVDAPPKVIVLSEPVTAKVYTDVIDAVTGAVLDTCAGCRSVRG